MWLHSLKVAQLLRSAACLHTNQSQSYFNHLVLICFSAVQSRGGSGKLVGSAYILFTENLLREYEKPEDSECTKVVVYFIANPFQERDVSDSVETCFCRVQGKCAGNRT